MVCVGEAGDGSSHTHLSAYDVIKTYVVGDDYQRHRWQCTTTLVSLLKFFFPWDNTTGLDPINKVLHYRILGKQNLFRGQVNTI